MTTKRNAVRLLIVLLVVGASVYAYDWYYRKPARDEKSRTYTVNKVTRPEWDYNDVYESFS